ncbi:MAG TPA: ATPase domain-containing protein [Tepidisphaeraceae bacterium]|jgi:circadian clock protein KaiC|nr:ATPase domain-containing protein [Tepidisphaeraceae bacterium]
MAKPTPPSEKREVQRPPVASTGIPGLDSILHGGLPREEMHLLQGVAGTGKTTAALHFLREGVREGEPTLYLTLSQSKAHLDRIARSHGWSLDGITVHELSPGTVADRVSSRQTIFPTVEVELGEMFRDVAEIVARVKPRRAVIDSITMLQLLAGSTQRYHREVVTLRQLFVEQGCTVLALADHPAENGEGSEPEVIFHPLSGCVMELRQTPRAYGDVRRTVRVVKARGLAHEGGSHDLKIRTGGMEVYPRLGAYTKPEYRAFRLCKGDMAELDKLLGGGLEEGTACLLIGPSGTGKSTLASLYSAAAAGRGDHAAIYLFDERPETYMARAEGVGIPLRKQIEAGRVALRQLDPAEIAPGEFAHQVCRAVEKEGSKVVVIDSIAGYFTAVGSSELFVAQLHELLTYLSRSGVLTILTAARQEAFMAVGDQPGVDISYLSDTILVLGYYEAEGDLHRYLTAVKKRQGEHETTIRELRIRSGGVSLGEPLRQFRGLLLTYAEPAAPREGGDGNNR